MSEDPLTERIQATLAATHDKPLDTQAHAVRGVVEQPSAPALTAYTGLLSGIIGLFVQPPATTAGGTGK